MSLILYYTGASKFNAIQQDSSKSLGGYISSTSIPNATIRNVFGDISAFTKTQNKPEFRAIAIKSSSAPTKTSLKAYFTYPQSGDPLSDSNVCEYQIGYAPVTADECGDLLSEQLSSIYATPYTVMFQNAVGIDNALQLPNLDNGNYLAIYIKRTLKASFIDPLTTQQYVDIMNKVYFPETQENISLTFDWV
jgi:hypothetical protein